MKMSRDLHLRFQSTNPLISTQVFPAAAPSAVSSHSRLILRFELWGTSDRNSRLSSSHRQHNLQVFYYSWREIFKEEKK
ncbi:hypothetical protein GQ457_15G012450 [Hibiscus cannabinus]